MASTSMMVKAFRDVGGGRDTISVFECKCALVRVIGAELPVKHLGRLLQRECGWKPDGTGISLAQFSDLCSVVEKERAIDFPRDDHYDVFDPRNKGWFEERDVYRVAMTLAPTFAEYRVKSIFAAADVYEVGQVSRRYYSSTVEEQKKLQSSYPY